MKLLYQTSDFASGAVNLAKLSHTFMTIWRPRLQKGTAHCIQAFSVGGGAAQGKVSPLNLIPVNVRFYI